MLRLCIAIILGSIFTPVVGFIVFFYFVWEDIKKIEIAQRQINHNELMNKMNNIESGLKLLSDNEFCLIDE